MKQPRNSGVTGGELSRQGEFFFRRLSEANIIGIITTDEQRILTANDEFLRMTGYSRADFNAGRINWRKITPPEHLSLSLLNLKEVKRQGWCVPFEKEYYRQDGSRVPILIGGARLTRKPFGCICFVLDLGARKRAEAALQTSESRWEMLVQSTPAAMVIHAADGRLLRCNAVAQKLLGIAETQARGKALHDPAWRFVREDGSRMPVEEYPVAQVLAKQAPVKNLVLGILRRTRQTDLIWVLVNALPRFAEDGALTEVLVAFMDITSRKQAESALAINEKRLRLALEAAKAATWSWDVAANQSDWDENYHRLYGFKQQEKKSFATWINRVHPGDRKRLLAQIQALLKPGAGNLWNEEFRAILPDGSERWMGGLGTVERTAGGQAIHMQGINLDISERKQSEEKLRRLNRTLQALGHSNRALLRATTEPEYLAEVCRIIVEDCGHTMVWVGFAEHDDAKTVRPAAHAGIEKGYLGKIHVSWADTKFGRGPTGTAIRTGRVTQCRNMETDPRFAPWRAEAIKRGYRSSAVFPLAADGQTFGALTIYSSQADVFDGEELRLLTELTGDVAMGLTTLRLRAAHAATEAALRELNATLEQRVAERTATLRESEQKFHRLFNTVADGVILLEGRTRRILEINDTACRMYGYTRQELLGQNALLLTAEPEASKASMADALAGLPERNPQRWHRRKDGTVFPVEVNAGSFIWRGKRLVCAVFRDITERKAMEQEILSISEREQRRIAQDLHDDLCQQLSGIQFLAHSLARSLADASRAESAEAEKLAGLLRDTLEKTRDLSRGLSPVELEADGLATAFRQLCARVEDMFRRKCVFHGQSFIPLPAAGTGIHLYRIAQEAVNNAIKHGQASRIDITLAAQRDKLILRIRDNGRGFPPRPEKPPGMGLRVMQYRATMLRGSLVVRQPAGGGTEVVCSVPAKSPSATARKAT